MASSGSNESEQAARVFRKGRKFSHLVADSEEELISFAKLIGLKKEWIQYPGTYKVHFDITARRFNKAKTYPNVKLLTFEEFVVLLTQRREKWIKKKLQNL